MNCYKCKKTIDKIHIDCTNDNTLQQSVLHHIDGCESCREYYNTIEQMIKDLSSFEEQELPKGFHNRLHFALQREAETPQKSSIRFSSGLKAAAAGAFALILIVAAVSILPRTMSSKDEGAMDMDAPMAANEEMMKAEMATMEDTQESDSAPAPDSKEFWAENADDVRNSESEESIAPPTVECDGLTCTLLSKGTSKVLVLDVDNVDEAYERILEFLPDAILLPDSSWVIDSMEEPDSYRQLRTLMTIDEVEYLSNKIGIEYANYNVLYETMNLSYDDIDNELAELQDDLAYLYIVLY